MSSRDHDTKHAGAGSDASLGRHKGGVYLPLSATKGERLSVRSSWRGAATNICGGGNLPLGLVPSLLSANIHCTREPSPPARPHRM